MGARFVRLPLATSLWPFTRIGARVAREVNLWRWRRHRAQIGAPVTLTRRRAGRVYIFESRRPGV
jgi:hypothetical protein